MRYLLGLIIPLLLSSCNFLPGMQNLNIASLPKERYQPEISAHPIVIPLTPTYFLTHTEARINYRIGIADVLGINVWKHPEFRQPADSDIMSTNSATQLSTLSGYVVNQRGQIFFPLLGHLNVAGKTPEAIRHTLTARLQTYIPNPQVSLKVIDFRSKRFYVMGEVIKPGLFPITDTPVYLTDAINIAGSFDPNSSDPSHIYVIRGNLSCPRIYWLNASSPASLLLGRKFQIRDGDIIVVSTAVVSRWNRFLNQLLPTLQTVWYTKAITGK